MRSLSTSEVGSGDGLGPMAVQAYRRNWREARVADAMGPNRSSQAGSIQLSAHRQPPYIR
jgi:hypothetical protein